MDCSRLFLSWAGIPALQLFRSSSVDLYEWRLEDFPDTAQFLCDSPIGLSLETLQRTVAHSRVQFPLDLETFHSKLEYGAFNAMYERFPELSFSKGIHLLFAPAMWK
jgi:hypothetical protein